MEHVESDKFDAIDKKIDLLYSNKDKWLEVSIAERCTILEELATNIMNIRKEWIEASNSAHKGDFTAEAITSSIWPSVRLCKQLIKVLKPAIQSQKNNTALKLKTPKINKVGNQFRAQVVPDGLLESQMFMGMTCDIWILPDHQPTQGGDLIKSFEEKIGKVSLVLGAGNVNSISFMDCLFKLFNQNQVVILKHNEINEYMYPILDKVMEPLIKRNFFHHVKGGADVGSYLCKKKEVENIHMTGSDRTYNAIVWGHPDPPNTSEQPILDKEFTSELGCVTPWIIVPCQWSKSDIEYQAQLLAGAFTNNDGFNCNNPKAIVIDKNWPQREEFMNRFKSILSTIPTRYCYYTGSDIKYKKAIEQYPNTIQTNKGNNLDKLLPFAIIPEIKPTENENFLNYETFGPITSEILIESKDTSDFLLQAVDLANNKMWGNLSCTMIVHPDIEKKYKKEVNNAIENLKYGTIAINTWAASAYALVSPVWGAYPGNTPRDIQSGTGFVHNSFMFDHPQKCVFKQPFRLFLDTKLFIVPSHKTILPTVESLLQWEYRGGYYDFLSYMWNES